MTTWQDFGQSPDGCSLRSVIIRKETEKHEIDNGIERARQNNSKCNISSGTTINVVRRSPKAIAVILSYCMENASV